MEHKKRNAPRLCEHHGLPCLNGCSVCYVLLCEECIKGRELFCDGTCSSVEHLLWNLHHSLISLESVKLTYEQGCLVKMAHFQYWVLECGFKLRFRSLSLGKFNISVLFLLTFPFVPLLPVQFLPCHIYLNSWIRTKKLW